ncbi:MAG: carboxylesterase family protein [Terracidiphilus sp.]
MKSVAIFFCLMLVAATVAAAAQTDTSAPLVASSKVAVVDTEAGKVQGFIHNGIYTYRGVPYAKAVRFMPPEKPDHWDGLRTALTYGYICPEVQMPQLNDVAEFLIPHRIWVTSDNCQNLNIWTPGIDDGKKRPVMVWFHGGGYTNGSSIEQLVYDGENLSRKGDVVVVTVNHRLNIMGFLDLSAYGPQYKYSGNVGIMDLVASLQWIKANIASFGGDPDNVTIFGQSGGGGKVNTLMSAPAAKGLFQKAIVESGAIRGTGMTLMDQKTSRRIAELTLQNLHLDPSELDELQKLPYEQINEAGQKALQTAAQESGHKGLFGPGYSWSPIVDGDYIPADPFSSGAPTQSKDIPLMIGTTLNEFPAMRMNPKLHGADDWSFDQLKSYFHDQYGDKADDVVAAYKKAYPDMKYSDWLHVDTMMRPGAIIEAELKADQQGAPVYNYLFAWQSPVLDGISRASHCAEIPFVFNNIAIGEQSTGGGKDAYALAESVSQAWINFARSGNPNNPGLPNWPAFTRASSATMIFDNQSEVRINFDKDLMKLLHPEMNF